MSAIDICQINKSYRSLHALKKVSFTVEEGEFFGLLGPNGAGKTTLISIMAGLVRADSGHIRIQGHDVVTDYRTARKKLGVVPQELVFDPFFTVRETLRLQSGYFGLKKNDDWIDEVMANLDLADKAEVNMRALSGGMKRRVLVAQALVHKPPVIVLDEPTAALTQTEVEELFKIMNDLRDKGIGMIYISHRMDEINRISDRVTVMRDGEYIGTVNTKDTTKDEIVRMMVGRVIYGDKKEKSAVPQNAETVLEVKHLNAGNEVKDVTFTLRKGEILGFAGLMGAGRTETARAIYGADLKDSGEIFVRGRKVRINGLSMR